MSSRAAGAAFLLIGSIAAVPAWAAAPPKPNPIASDSDGGDEILITARRDHGTVATDVRPEVSLNSAVIQSLGAADLAEVFRELAPEIGGAVAGSPGASEQRGGAPVVLVNGQRIAGFSAIKDFPPETVARIEVFPEKVALQYGFAAGQRVVNVVLREHYRAVTVLGRTTLAPDNWRGIYRAKLDIVRIGDSSHWNLALDYAHTDSIFDTTTLGTPPAGAGTDPVAAFRHTLAAQDDHLTASGTFNRKFGGTTAELGASLDLDALQSRPGLSIADGDLLAEEGLAGVITAPVDRLDRTVQARTNLVLNGKLDRWRWSFIGRLEDSTRETRTGPATTDGGLTAVLIPSPGLLGQRCGALDGPGCVSTDVRRASGDLYLNGDLATLPWGHVTAALRTGVAFAGIRGDGALQSTAHDRDEGSAQANIDVPLAGAGAAIGKLTAGLNADVHQLSDFGTLAALGATLDWAPSRAIELIASVSRSRQAPTLVQIGQAALVTPDLREYDFVTGGTTIVARTESGNPGLTPDRARVAKARLQLSPLARANLSLSAEYTLDRTRDPIVVISAATAATAAAFPGHFVRENGYLTALDVSAVNAVSRDSQQLRWGLNYATAFGGAWLDRAGRQTAQRNQFQIALYDNWRLQDRLLLAPGQAKLDLRHGDVIADDGGTAAHRVELQTSVALRKVSADVSAVWQTPTTAYAQNADRLTFSQGVTFNLRLQINLAYQPWLTHLLPILRGSLNLSADNLLGAHMRVHDSSGAVPLAYASSYLNPTGRTFRITLRKRFR